MTLVINLLLTVFCLEGSVFLQPANLQSTRRDTVKIWPIMADRISADPLGQFYMVTAGTLIKYNPQGDSVYSWSEPKTGRINRIDTNDPMRILVYQKDFNLLRFLNNRLSPISTAIRLDDLNLNAPLAFAASRQGGFWVLDGTDFRLKYIDQQLKITVESEPLNLPSGNYSVEYQMIESGDQVLLLIPGREIQVFDLFANPVKKYPVKVESFTAYGNSLLLAYPDQVTLWKDVVTPETTLLKNKAADIREACLFRNQLLIRTPLRVILISL